MTTAAPTLHTNEQGDQYRLYPAQTITVDGVPTIFVSTQTYDRGYKSVGTWKHLIVATGIGPVVYAQSFWDFHTKLWVVYRLDRKGAKYQVGSADYVPSRDDVSEVLQRYAAELVADPDDYPIY